MESVCGERVDGLQMDGSDGPAGEERHPPLVFRPTLLDKIRAEEVDAGVGEGRFTKSRENWGEHGHLWRQRKVLKELAFDAALEDLSSGCPTPRDPILLADVVQYCFRRRLGAVQVSLPFDEVRNSSLILIELPRGTWLLAVVLQVATLFVWFVCSTWNVNWK